MAAKKKAAEPKALVLASRAPAVYRAIEQIAELAAHFSGEVEANVTVENIDKGVEVLARVRAANKKLADLCDEATADLKAKIKEIESERNKLRAHLNLADTKVAERILAIYREVPEEGKEALTKRMEGSLGSSATVTHRSVTIEVVDANDVPDKYILPPPSRADRVDLAAIADALKAGEKVPGVRALPNYYLTTRAAEIIK